MKQFLMIKEAAKESGLAQSYIRTGCKNGTIPHIKCGNKYLVNYPLFLERLNENSIRRAANG